MAVPSKKSSDKNHERLCRIKKKLASLKEKIQFFFLTNPLCIYKTTSGKFLPRNAVRVLVYCVYSCFDIICFNDGNFQENFLEAYLLKKMSKSDIYNALTYLNDIGLIEDLCGDKKSYTFHITPEGVYFFELRRLNFIHILLTSFIFPIVISIITTIITLLISGAL